MKLGTLVERIKPDHGANDKYDHGVRQEEPIEDDETNGDMIPLNYGTDG
jgi:hypothetical protein